MTTVLRNAFATVSFAALLLTQPLHAQQEAAEPTAAPEATSELQRITERGTLRVGVNPEFRPFSFLDDDEQRVGVDADIATQLAEALGVELELTAPGEFTELIPMLVDERIDLILAGMSITFERAKEVAFTNPYFDTGMSVMMNVGTSARLGIANAKDSDALLEALAEDGRESRLTIAVTEGKAPALEAERRFPDAEIVTYPSNEEAAEATFTGEAHLMLHDEIFLKLWVDENGSRGGHRVVVLDPPIKPDFYGIAVRQGDPDWVRLLDVFVRELRSNGQVIAYLEEYLPSMTMTAGDEDTAPIFDLADME